MLDKTELNVLILTMLGEARGEGVKGMAAVGLTTRNRADLKSWRGLTIQECCLKPYQYSCWLPGPDIDWMGAVTEDSPEYQAILSTAQSIIDGSFTDFTGGATYYYRAGSVIPLWAANKTPCFIYGHHLFFKDIA